MEMRKFGLAAIATLVAVQAFGEGSVGVTIANFKFGPEKVAAAANQPITWTNKDGVPHQIVIAAKNLKTAVLSRNQSAALTIAEPGRYDYICGIHPSMKGTIIVK
jgi:plastocyanin